MTIEEFKQILLQNKIAENQKVLAAQQEMEMLPGRIEESRQRFLASQPPPPTRMEIQLGRILNMLQKDHQPVQLSQEDQIISLLSG